MRSFEEIVERCNQPGNFFWGNQFARQILVPYLRFEHAQEFLTPDTTEEDWHGDDIPRPINRDYVIGEMRDYMPFALMKADNERGLSAMRSLDKFRTWLWLLRDESPLIETANSGHNYGIDILEAICECYGFDPNKREG